MVWLDFFRPGSQRKKGKTLIQNGHGRAWKEQWVILLWDAVSGVLGWYLAGISREGASAVDPEPIRSRHGAKPSRLEHATDASPFQSVNPVHFWPSFGNSHFRLGVPEAIVIATIEDQQHHIYFEYGDWKAVSDALKPPPPPSA